MISVFLAHSKKNRRLALKLTGDLTNHGIKVWIDEAELSIGDSIISKIENGLINADYIVVMLSPHSVNSEWVKKELESALILEIKDKKAIVLPVLIKSCDIPLFLQTKLYADFRTPKKYSEQIDRLISSIK